jgi:hypothetical protein
MADEEGDGPEKLRQWLARAAMEEVIEPSLPIVDPVSATRNPCASHVEES